MNNGVNRKKVVPYEKIQGRLNLEKDGAAANSIENRNNLSERQSVFIQKKFPRPIRVAILVGIPPVLWAMIYFSVTKLF